MRHLIRLLALGAAAACSTGTGNPSDLAETGMVVYFAFDGHPADTLPVLVTHAATIEAAKQYVATQRGPRIPVGPIVRGATLDDRYPYHFIPDSVRLAEMAIELCDGAPMRTAAAVDAFFAGVTGSASAEKATWCPWGAYPIRVQEPVAR